MPSKSVLIYRIGSIGDTLVALPALWAVREHFKDARITLLCDYHPRRNYALAADLLTGSGIIDDFMRYRVDPSTRGRLLMPLHLASLVLALRRRNFDTLVYLPPTGRQPHQVERDRKFFRRLAGIRDIIGMDVDLGYPARPAPGALVPREADQLLSHIAGAIPVPPPGQGRTDLALNENDDEPVRAWLARIGAPDPADGGGRPWVGVGPGSKMPAKIWPRERFRDVLADLIARFDVCPVIFGGPEDRDVGQWLVEQLGRGFVAAGELGLRPSASALARCKLYLGNDTGTMHMAAAAAVPCVAIFSARTWPGMWFPYGPNHRPFQADIDCAGCNLMQCIDRKMECVMRISVTEVRDACIDVLSKQLARAESPPPGAPVSPSPPYAGERAG